VKYAFIREQRPHYPLVRLCSALGVSRSGYYDWLMRMPSARARANARLVEEMRHIHGEVYRSYGSPRMHVELLHRGFTTSRGRVERLMRANGIRAERTNRHRRCRRHREVQPAEPNLLDRQFHAAAPNQKWVSDITFIETRQGWLYLAVVLDLYSRAIVGWSMRNRLTADLVRDALTMAVQHRDGPRGTLVHSDQGSQYTAAVYREDLARYGMIPSMSRKGECHDNAVAESFFHTLKDELTGDEMFKTRDEARQAIFRYIELFYNRKRRHSYLGYQAPLAYETMNAA
jgi:transposase InsO family protein